ncbi:hypothetical protein P280DRAFT_147299 [Massarina eburnea CBS 473.64]|uniref:Uncharacterized protein n=1 Tax=Massarina eburnea CBS 473.64 TaxID=1395130 RepID=A0A6A6RRK9_9PLEO|nr:hypothetical protein P280DRAFT_147299 [Massarina eburnea CBS 473.64]
MRAITLATRRNLAPVIRLQTWFCDAGPHGWAQRTDTRTHGGGRGHTADDGKAGDGHAGMADGRRSERHVNAHTHRHRHGSLADVKSSVARGRMLDTEAPMGRVEIQRAPRTMFGVCWSVPILQDAMCTVEAGSCTGQARPKASASRKSWLPALSCDPIASFLIPSSTYQFARPPARCRFTSLPAATDCYHGPARRRHRGRKRTANTPRLGRKKAARLSALVRRGESHKPVHPISTPT